MMDGHWLSQHKHVWSVNRRAGTVPLRAELLPLTGAVSDTRMRDIDPRCFERRLPKWIAALLLLVLTGLGWALVWALWKLGVQLWRWAEPALGLLAGLTGGAALGMFLIGAGPLR